MSFRVLTQHDVRELLPMDECVDVMAGALAALSRGDALLPLRTMMWLPERAGLLGLMPSYLGEPRCFGLKAISYMPGNEGTAYESHQGAVLLFEPEHGCLLAVLDASTITEIRTAAASGLATRLLAREDAGDLAILGSGTQAASHLEAMKTVRSLRRVRVWSRDANGARAFADREGRRFGLNVEVAASAQEAVRGADLICTTTSAREPVLRGEWLAPGAHVNAVGACFPTTRELDTDAVVRSRLYVDRRESTLHEAGDFLIPKAEGALGDEHIVGEIGDVVLGKVPGRRSASEITLFKSLGIAIEDLAAAHHIYRKAIATGNGVPADLGGKRNLS
jgi:ornithine cyclodeaminase/alanine dehydrogenase-like protein (mu-crystallin family)